MKITIPTNAGKYFGQVLEILSTVPPFSTLTKRERDIYAEFLRINMEMKDLPVEERASNLFSAENKENIRLALNISKANVHMAMYNLRKKGFITYGYFARGFEMTPSRSIVFEFKNEE